MLIPQSGRSICFIILNQSRSTTEFTLRANSRFLSRSAGSE